MQLKFTYRKATNLCLFALKYTHYTTLSLLPYLLLTAATLLQQNNKYNRAMDMYSMSYSTKVVLHKQVGPRLCFKKRFFFSLKFYLS